MARSNLQIKVGTYTGNGVDDTQITGIGFRPDFIIVKGVGTHAVMRTKSMLGDSTGYLATATSNLANSIQEILNDGFMIGTDATVNTNAVVYYYMAIRGISAQNYFRVGRYTGNGADDRNYTGGDINFTPEFAIIKRDGATNADWRGPTLIGDATGVFNNVGVQTDRIQAFISNGFQIGTNNEVNSNNQTHHFLAMKTYPGMLASGTYVGTGVAGKTVTGIGFSPDFLIVKREGVSVGVLTTSNSTPSSYQMSASGALSGGITALGVDGFTVGSAGQVNTNGDTYHYIAFKAGDFSLPLSRSSV
jgi:hypothetical protein